MIHKSIPITDHPPARPYRIVRHAIDANLEVLILAYRQKIETFRILDEN